MKISDRLIDDLVLTAFKTSIENEEIGDSNSKKSSYFVSQLAKLFSDQFDKNALVQTTDRNGKKSSGEWLLDIVIVSKDEIRTSYKNRKSDIVKKIHWAIESEFSTSLNEFSKDFSKLLHIRSEAYLYVAGINQISEVTRNEYINAQTELAVELVSEQGIDKPFYLAFVPTPGKIYEHSSLWNSGYEQLSNWVKVVNLSSLVTKCT
ncbi:hypothetical protein Q4491_19765 [Photobacterium sp. 2_MG-2023]|uniref:hypothetical protein n=1 Tax=Photobacterium sp. 2_MG-2023 TaxID=3062663 RepID=UPI0026E14986|nr:hypothetical protein [Photobacterium sp. 2_MG-2023]MDO6583582.1 hypothetical protein [Photobacterium sp. 2_MG-2023]